MNGLLEDDLQTHWDISMGNMYFHCLESELRMTSEG